MKSSAEGLGRRGALGVLVKTAVVGGSAGLVAQHLAQEVPEAGETYDASKTPVVKKDRDPTLVLGDATKLDDLVAPLKAGAKLGQWTLVRHVPMNHGATGLVMHDEQGRAFQLDICARDNSKDAAQPPARTQYFDIFLSNEGTGKTASFEKHGLAAMAIADVIRQNEADLKRDGYLTLRDRLSMAYAQVSRHV